MRLRLLLAMLGLIGLLYHPTDAQFAPCGIVDSFDYPIDELVQGYDDFGLYRARFGGNHVGIDVAFDRWGDPVQAVARGRVTYSDIEGWGTEKGVVIVEHTLPDGAVIYTLYGHMEQTDDIFFPDEGDCVRPGDVLGAVGWPSRGRPHLHYEIRNFMPDDGGPGYVTDDPLRRGWYHPLDFTHLWRMRLSPAYISATTFEAVPALPPVLLDNNSYAIASGQVVEAGLEAGSAMWRIETDDVITGLAGLSGGRVVTQTRSGQVSVVQNGRYVALWQVVSTETAFRVLADETLVFATPGGGLSAYDAAGNLRWQMDAFAPDAEASSLLSAGAQVALVARLGDGRYGLRLVGGDGTLHYETEVDALPVLAADSAGSWMALVGDTVKRYANGSNDDLNRITPEPGRSARMTVDLLGNSYVYLGDADNTLLSLDPAGVERWRTAYPTPAAALPPLLATGNGCLLYTLDMDGLLHVFETASGDPVNAVQLYAGGRQSGQPRARLLRVDRQEQIQVSSGFLTLFRLDGWALGGTALDGCLLG